MGDQGPTGSRKPGVCASIPRRSDQVVLRAGMGLAVIVREGSEAEAGRCSCRFGLIANRNPKCILRLAG